MEIKTVSETFYIPENGNGSLTWFVYLFLKEKQGAAIKDGSAFKSLATLPEDSGSLPSIHAAAHNHM